MWFESIIVQRRTTSLRVISKTEKKYNLKTHFFLLYLANFVHANLGLDDILLRLHVMTLENINFLP